MNASVWIASEEPNQVQTPASCRLHASSTASCRSATEITLSWRIGDMVVERQDAHGLTRETSTTSSLACNMVKYANVGSGNDTVRQ